MAILILGAFVDDAMSRMMDLQFRFAQREDATVTFVAARDPAVLDDLRRLPGVTEAEPFRGVPAVLRNGNRTWRIAILGLPPEARLHRVVDLHGRLVPVPSAGLLLTGLLADKLDVQPGDELQVEVLEGTRPRRAVRVAGRVDDPLGLSATMDLDELNALAGRVRR